MHESYHDIRDLTPEPPMWFDEHAVPRYCVFTPDRIADIYARSCCLLRIECQDCGTEFNVAMSENQMDAAMAEVRKERHVSLEDQVRHGTIHYGDPPNTGCCAAGPTMNCMDIEVLEFWNRVSWEWKRVPELEVKLPDYDSPP